MDIKLLRTFQAVAEHGNFTAAAAARNCVQSNVTVQIRRLEQHFGQPLFVRGKNGARLTWFGERLHARARELLRLFDEAEAQLLEQAGGAAPLTLGALETIAATRLPEVLLELRARCPDAPVSLRTGASGDLLAQLWRREVDAAFVAGPVDPDRYAQVPAFTETLVHVTPRTPVEGAPLLAFQSGCSYRAMAERWLSAEGADPLRIVDMGSLDGILGCVVAGLGFAVVPASVTRTYHALDRLILTPLPAPFDRVVIHLVWRHDHAPVEAHRALVDMFATPAAA